MVVVQGRTIQLNNGASSKSEHYKKSDMFPYRRFKKFIQAYQPFFATPSFMA